MPAAVRQALIDARQAKGFKRPADLARAMGVSRSTVWRWERENRLPAYGVMKRVSDLLGKPVDDLFG